MNTQLKISIEDTEGKVRPITNGFCPMVIMGMMGSVRAEIMDSPNSENLLFSIGPDHANSRVALVKGDKIIIETK
jgi:hypothetical protein